MENLHPFLSFKHKVITRLDDVLKPRCLKIKFFGGWIINKSNIHSIKPTFHGKKEVDILMKQSWNLYKKSHLSGLGTLRCLN